MVRQANGRESVYRLVRWVSVYRLVRWVLLVHMQVHVDGRERAHLRSGTAL